MIGQCRYVRVLFKTKMPAEGWKSGDDDCECQPPHVIINKPPTDDLDWRGSGKCDILSEDTVDRLMSTVDTCEREASLTMDICEREAMLAMDAVDTTAEGQRKLKRKRSHDDYCLFQMK